MKSGTIVLCALWICATAAGQDGFDRELTKGAEAVRARADELRFRTIPWVTDLFEGVRLAREEKRPLFLVSQFGDPLEDC